MQIFKRKYLSLYLILLIFSIQRTYSQVDSIFSKCPQNKGEYFSDVLPGEVPQIFAPNLLNSEIHHLHSSPVFTPNKAEMFFSVYVNNIHPQRIFHSIKKDGVWQKPDLAIFSGKYLDGGPVISFDGNLLFFYSKRPDIDGEEPLTESRIWIVKKKNGNWLKPELLSFPNELGVAFYPSYYSANGILYFYVKVKDRDYDIFQCRIEDNKPIEIRRLDEPISIKDKIEGGAITDPNGKVLIFHTYDRYGCGKEGLYYCIKAEDGKWSEPKLFDSFEILKYSRFASFTSDGKYFFFLSYKEKYEQIFWVSSQVIFNEIFNK